MNALRLGKGVPRAGKGGRAGAEEGWFEVDEREEEEAAELGGGEAMGGLGRRCVVVRMKTQEGGGGMSLM